MPLIVNGITIPTNVANVLMVNGVSVTQVIANGVQVWLQSLINIVNGWSGSSWANYSGAPGSSFAFDISGTSWRGASYGAYVFNVGFTYIYGAWISTSNLGIFSGNTTTTVSTIVTSGSLIKVNNGNWVTYTPSSMQFSGYSGGLGSDGMTNALNTSAGLIRAEAKNPSTLTYGQWVSLT